ncbi:glycosyltransferase family 2 protein [Oceaniglobus trochenteri]|uniref:glycosyltransferase family 2 protein n=1 Tax=Oceaniglobus trochenteri TaxID=2763260 RepID=UPI001CFFC60A|nr:glycosyltransferase family 2 protein [Oceaniglobus trochenteri]
MAETAQRRAIRDRLLARLTRLERRLRLWRGVRHVQGPARFDLGPDDVVVVALVRDGMFYLDEFLRHHRAIGARHFVFFDNGSQDATLARLKDEPGCAVLQSTLPWGDYENDFRAIAARRYSMGHWCLFVDMDEMFDPPGNLPLPDLARRLRQGDHSALVAQMLEMFADAPLRDMATLPYDQVLQRFDHCDLGHVTTRDYHDPAIGFSWWLNHNTAPPEVKILFGGLRNRVFGEDCCLTKHPLVHLSPGVMPAVHPHCSAHVRCSDVTGVIRHYKFANHPAARDARSVESGAIPHGEDRLRLSRMQGDPALSLMGPTAQRYTGEGMLRDAGFLVGRAP